MYIYLIGLISGVLVSSVFDIMACLIDVLSKQEKNNYR